MKSNLNDKINVLTRLIEKETKERYISQFGKDSFHIHERHTKTQVKPGRKYIKIDVGLSGKYMITKEGEIFGIKGYGVMHFGHHYGTLETINQYYWGEYTASKK